MSALRRWVLVGLAGAVLAAGFLALGSMTWHVRSMDRRLASLNGSLSPVGPSLERLGTLKDGIDRLEEAIAGMRASLDETNSDLGSLGKLDGMVTELRSMRAQLELLRGLLNGIQSSNDIQRALGVELARTDARIAQLNVQIDRLVSLMVDIHDHVANIDRKMPGI
ncbi:MAG: hypothetical protein WDA71_08670 [Actinomycetota bacterium]